LPARYDSDYSILRRNNGIEILIKQQLKLLTTLAPLVTKGAVLVYSTCSLLPEENLTLIKCFLAAYPGNITLEASQQLLPGISDGFFFAKLRCR
jgi:16S rRNA (cytosine967-C5)-methyltransferase